MPRLATLAAIALALCAAAHGFAPQSSIRRAAAFLPAASPPQSNGGRRRRPQLLRQRATPAAVTSEGAEATMPGSMMGAYGADQITVLEGLEPVRKRPGM